MQQLENHAQNFTAYSRRRRRMGQTVIDPITIKVYVHLLYTSERNHLSEAQIQSQIDRLNDDFNKNNVDTPQDETDSPYYDIAGNTSISFNWSSNAYSERQVAGDFLYISDIKHSAMGM